LKSEKLILVLPTDPLEDPLFFVGLSLTFGCGIDKFDTGENLYS